MRGFIHEVHPSHFGFFPPVRRVSTTAHHQVACDVLEELGHWQLGAGGAPFPCHQDWISAAAYTWESYPTPSDCEMPELVHYDGWHDGDGTSHFDSDDSDDGDGYG